MYGKEVQLLTFAHMEEKSETYGSRHMSTCREIGDKDERRLSNDST